MPQNCFSNVMYNVTSSNTTLLIHTHEISRFVGAMFDIKFGIPSLASPISLNSVEIKHDR